MNIKYIDFNYFAVLSWDIKSTSLSYISLLSEILIEENLDEIVNPKDYVILSTCNRVEVYLYSRKNNKTIDTINSFILENSKGIKNDQHEVYNGVNALTHLIKVTSGLKSVAIGEYQIQGQVKKSLKHSLLKNIKYELIKIFETALKVGKKIRYNTKIGNKNISLTSLAIESVLKNTKQINRPSIFIIGTGKLSQSASEYFMSKGFTSITYFSRFPHIKKDFINYSFDTVLPLKEFKNQIKSNIIIFIAISQNAHRISLPKSKNKLKTISIIDLSVPRYFTNSHELKLVDMDYLKNFELSNYKQLRPFIEKSNKIIRDEVNNLFAQNKLRYFLNNLIGDNLNNCNSQSISS